ncbi:MULTISPECIES: glutamate-1-semialdehyde 2,1-aminomutase [Leptospira]|uniref:Glutamate-1-semialdehyde 2,1-aminomutase n=4 Tax=Leptospira borgpetersenii TaxID=174 RepID=M3F6L9_LEPBO|nr:MULTISPECIES: glutamate-1-semialdehyde 2,1-aminomutase [Leptospira]EMF97612.1 putative glutamate-1-semialdehyde-2,1-aminomutase [Leptospira borgpetersenii str. 200701203]EMO09463.1 putative glutamate-1-semialdehyde-2,1-aminomutase [Leptospira borgpetersenii str. Noumea 25]ALO28182.1 putative glutamate-1-semialdehyde-2,1-aminomutase [Leptospira borgpetersenii serovar Ballum]ANH02016.2 Glutamate-1-semialdehyde 2,1-aminomutase [Leptospira borgpetersenii str. 4E]AXX17608.1 aspartate aminotransf
MSQRSSELISDSWKGSSSEGLFERAKIVSPGGVHSPVRSFRSVGGTPVFFVSANGATLTDVSGKEYVDFCLSFGPLILGHRDPEVEEVVRETAGLAWSFGTAEPYSLELAEFITNRIPWAEKVRFVNSGTEAVMSALRVARAATGREKIFKFDGCYHGHLDALLVKAGSGLAGESSSDSAGISSTAIANTLVLPLDDEMAVQKLFESEGKNIAALIIEPLPANYGLLVQRKEFLLKIVEIAKKYGTLVVFDEVISGFRTGFQGMSGLLGIRPDLVTYGKIIGGGFPVGCYAGRRDLLDLVAPSGPVYQAGTLSANPFGMRAGLATLKKAERDSIYSVLEVRTKTFADEMVKLLNGKTDQEWEAVTHSSLFWFRKKTQQAVRRIDQIPEGHKEGFAEVFHVLLKNGIYLAPSGYEVGFLSWAHNDSMIAKVLEIADKAFKGL